jgi:uncharacterized membrane protein YeaQ/YmgE (transglycosylase-associated protein family)
VIGFILGMLIVGLVVGAIARLLLPGREPMGCLGTAVLGLVGSFVGGFLADLVLGHPGRAAAFHPAGLIGSVIGAMLLLLLLRVVRRDRRY